MAAEPTAAAKRWTLVATIVASGMTFIDGTVVNVALPGLQAGLGATITEVQWVIEAYALFLGALILVGGSLGDQLGRKRVFVFGVASFAGASALCGFAPNAILLIVGRALQGIGAAFLVPGSLAIITATFDDKERGAAIGTWSGFSAITMAIGPVLGGWLIEQVSWRAVFFINVPLAALVLFLSFRHIEESRDESRTGATDWTGAALTVVGLSGLVLGLLEWPPLGPSPLVISSLAIGTLCIVVLPFVEHRSESPMLPLALFRSRTFSLANLLTVVLYAALAVMMFLVPMNMIQVHGYSATAAGASLLPFPIIIFALSRWAGGLVARIGSRIPLTIGPAVAAVGLLALARAGTTGAFWTTFFPGIVILGVGMAVTVAPLTTTVMNAAERIHSGAASGVNNAVSRVGGLLAIAVFSVMLSRAFDTRVAERLRAIPLPADTRAGVERELPKMAGAELSKVSSLSPEQSGQVRAAINASFADAFQLAMIAAATLALLAAAFGFAIKG